jgi:hypothetical protein
MALQKDITTQLRYALISTDTPDVEALIEKDYTVKNAYIKINKVIGDKENVVINVLGYKEDKTNVVSSNEYSFVPSVAEGAVEWIKQGYEYLKTLDEFKGAIDC